MTTFDDLTRTFTDGLSKITTYVPKVIGNFQKGDNQFRTRKDDLVDSYSVDFQGLGALAFANAVENNIEIGSRLEQKLNEFVMASNHAATDIHNANNTYGDQINNFIPGVGVQGLEYYGYTYDEVDTQLRDGTLAVYIDLGGVLDFNLQFMLTQLDDAKTGFWSIIQYKYSQNIDQYQQLFDRQTKGIDKKTGIAQINNFKQYQQTSVTNENSYLNQARIELDAIYKNQEDAFTNWYNIMVQTVSTYDNEIAWAGATGQVSVGDLLQDLVNAPNGSPVVIYRSSDGGLVVAVNSINNGKSPAENALLVQKAIAEYDELNGITNPKVTILGYQGGSDIVQNLANDKNPFQLANVVLIGGKITQTPAVGVNYVDYLAPGDSNAGTGNPSIVPHSSTDVANDLVDGGEIVLGGATGGVPGVLIATGEVITSTVVPMAVNNGNSSVYGADPNNQFTQVPSSLAPNQTIGGRTLLALPDEPGEARSVWKLSTSYPFVKGRDINYTQSAYLNMVGLPDPQTGKTLAGFEPISPPTYYNVP